MFSHDLEDVEALKMRGRSKVVFQNKERNNLEGIDLEEDKSAWCLATKAEWYRQTAGQHNRLSNKLTSIAKQMKAAAKSGRGQREKEQSKVMITNTLKSYVQLAGKLSNKKSAQRYPERAGRQAMGQHQQDLPRRKGQQHQAAGMGSEAGGGGS